MSKEDVACRVFTCDGYRYEIYGTQVQHQDYDTLLLAWRQTLATGARSPVIMKPFPAPQCGEWRERGWEEVQIATHLEHANIAKVYGIALSPDKTFYVVMESMPGMYLLTALDLALLLGRRFSPAFAAYVTAMVADGLCYAHGRNDRDGEPLHIIHRAVGPMRIRLGFNGRVKLTNFGAAYSELRDRLQTPPGVLRGDAAYTAPEIWRAVMASPGPRFDPLISGVIDGRADVFSLGLVLLEMLLAEYPLDPTDAPAASKPLPLAAKVQTERPSWIAPSILAERILRFNADEVEQRSEPLPKGLRETVRCALHSEPSERLDASMMRDELLAYLASRDRPFGAEEVAQELKSIFDAAKNAKRLLANPIERTALSSREDGGA